MVHSLEVPGRALCQENGYSREQGVEQERMVAQPLVQRVFGTETTQ